MACGHKKRPGEKQMSNRLAAAVAGNVGARAANAIVPQRLRFSAAQRDGYARLVCGSVTRNWRKGRHISG